MLQRAGGGGLTPQKLSGNHSQPKQGIYLYIYKVRLHMPCIDEISPGAGKQTHSLGEEKSQHSPANLKEQLVDN